MRKRYISHEIKSKVIKLKLTMVRYFQNTFEDYNNENGITISKDEIAPQINDHVNNILKRLRPSHKTVDGGLYVGSTGISYMFYHLSKNALLSENKEFYIEKGIEYLKPALECTTGDKTSFLLGNAGTLAIATALYQAVGSEKYAETLQLYKSLFNTYLNPKFLKSGADEFFVGRSGYLAGVLWLTRELKTLVLPKGDLYKLCNVVVESGRNYAMRRGGPQGCPLMYHYYKTEYLGAAHGISFIMQMLISVPGYLESSKLAESNVKSTIYYLLSLQTDDGNWPCCMEEVNLDEHKLVHWCHGGPGVVYLMAKSYLIFKDKAFLNACVKTGDLVWNKGLLRKGPGICHGIAGNGYVFLLLYRLTGDDKHLYRAKIFADFMNSDIFLRESRVPDNPESLYEGTGGTVCFLSDLLVPDTAEFPFQDVFSSIY